MARGRGPYRIPLNRQTDIIEYITFLQLHWHVVMTVNAVHGRNKIFKKTQLMRICFRSRHGKGQTNGSKNYLDTLNPFQFLSKFQYILGVKAVYQIFVNSL